MTARNSATDTVDYDTRAETWFFEVIVRLQSDQTFSNLLNARERELETCLETASVISWACAQNHSQKYQERCVWKVLYTMVPQLKFGRTR